jgi:hypothetical protein
LKVQTHFDPEEDKKKTNVSLRDFQVIQEDFEILLKHHGAAVDLAIVDENLEDASFDKQLIQFKQSRTEEESS